MFRIKHGLVLSCAIFLVVALVVFANHDPSPNPLLTMKFLSSTKTPDGTARISLFRLTNSSNKSFSVDTLISTNMDKSFTPICLYEDDLNDGSRTKSTTGKSNCLTIGRTLKPKQSVEFSLHIPTNVVQRKILVWCEDEGYEWPSLLQRLCAA